MKQNNVKESIKRKEMGDNIKRKERKEMKEKGEMEENIESIERVEKEGDGKGIKI